MYVIIKYIKLIIIFSFIPIIYFVFGGIGALVAMTNKQANTMMTSLVNNHSTLTSSFRSVTDNLMEQVYGYDLKELSSNKTLLNYVQTKANVSSSTIIWELGKIAFGTNSKEKLLAVSHIIPQDVKNIFIVTGTIAVIIYLVIISLIVLKWICSYCCCCCCCKFCKGSSKQKEKEKEKEKDKLRHIIPKNEEHVVSIENEKAKQTVKQNSTNEKRSKTKKYKKKT